VAGDYVTFLLDLAGSGDNRAIQETVAYRRSSRQPETAFVWKVTCDVRGKVIIAGLADEELCVIATARWHGKIAEHKQVDPAVPTTFQWELVETALRTELERRELVLDRSREAAVSNAELIEDDVLDARTARAPVRKAEVSTVPIAMAIVAVGTTGELIKRMTARFCGAVTGKSGSQVAMVGMFDLPENRSPVVEQ